MIILRIYKIDSDKKRLPCHDSGVANIAVVERRAKDGDTKMSSGMVSVGCVVGGGASRTVSVAPADLDFGLSVCPGATPQHALPPQRSAPGRAQATPFARR